jgi:transposase-like protein
MVRHSLNYVSFKRSKEVAADLRRIYAAATLKEADSARRPLLCQLKSELFTQKFGDSQCMTIPADTA